MWRYQSGRSCRWLELHRWSCVICLPCLVPFEANPSLIGPGNSVSRRWIRATLFMEDDYENDTTDICADHTFAFP